MSKKKIQIAKKITETLEEINKTEEVENLIKDNTMYFFIDNVKYRVRKPTLEEQQIANKARMKKYRELLNDDDYMFREEWIKILKKKGIDIEELDNSMLKLQEKVNSLLLKLATEKDEKSVDLLKKEIIKLREEQNLLSIKKADYLQYSIEDTLIYFTTSYVCYLVFEKQDGDKWARVYDSYDAFKQETDEKLISNALYYLNYLMYNLEF